MKISCRIAGHGKWRFLFSFVAHCAEDHLWEEWDKWLLLDIGVRTPPLRTLCARPDKEWSGTTGGGMGILLMRQKAIWMKMEEVFNTTSGQTRVENIDTMIVQIMDIREALCPKSMSQLAIHLSKKALATDQSWK